MGKFKEMIQAAKDGGPLSEEQVRALGEAVLELEEDLDSCSESLKEIIATLGPGPPNCGCRGCGYEMSSALRSAKDAYEKVTKSRKESP